MKIYDVSMTIREGMLFEEKQSPLHPQLVIQKANPEQNKKETTLTLSTHLGTHILSPSFMLEGGQTIEQINLKRLFTDVRLFDLTHVKDSIKEMDLQKLDIQKNDFVLFKTRNSFNESFLEHTVSLDPESASYLVEKQVSGVGMDGFSLAKTEDTAVYQTLFAQSILIIEGLLLKEAPPGRYIMSALPLKIAGVESAPARVILLKNPPSTPKNI